jgi:hypothetical protein
MPKNEKLIAKGMLRDILLNILDTARAEKRKLTADELAIWYQTGQKLQDIDPRVLKAVNVKLQTYMYR